MVELFANSGDPDQTPRSAASDLGQHCLPVTGLGISSLHRKFGRFTKYSCILPGIHLSYPALCILLVIRPAFLYPTGHSCILLVDVMCCSVAELQASVRPEDYSFMVKVGIAEYDFGVFVALNLIRSLSKLIRRQADDMFLRKIGVCILRK